MNYEKVTKENELLSAEDEKLRALCRSLKQVDAPPDFDFKLKARLADKKANPFQPRFGFAFRYALPALLLMLAFGLFAYQSGTFTSQNSSLTAMGETPQQNSNLSQNSSRMSFTPPEKNETVAVNPATLNPEPSKTANPVTAPVAGNVAAVKKNESHRSQKEIGGGSKDIASTVIKTIEPTLGAPRNPPPTPKVAEVASPLSIKEILSITGINAELANGKWLVKSVTANSVGESSGVKANDIIEAIDEQSLSAETSFDKTISGKTVTVLREGQKKVIKIQNK